MGTAWPEKLPTNRKRAIGELVQGREFATQLQNLLDKPSEDHGSVSAEELVLKILTSFTDTLSVLCSCDSGEVGQIPVTTHVGHTCSGDRTSLDSGESRKSPAVKDRRGSYKRRKTSQSWMTVSPTMEDGSAWRKYGQKEILNAKHPRCYFRCTHKVDQGCQAIKQVQRMEEDPNMYQTTYFGHHTCTYIQKAPQIISDSDPVGSYLIGFDSFESKVPNKQNHQSSCLSIPLIKEECKEETRSELSDNLSSLESTWWPDLMALESSEPAMMLSQKPGSDHEDVVSSGYSCASTSSYGLDMETLIRSVDFNNDFHFDEIEFL